MNALYKSTMDMWRLQIISVPVSVTASMSPLTNSSTCIHVIAVEAVLGVSYHSRALKFARLSRSLINEHVDWC